MKYRSGVTRCPVKHYPWALGHYCERWGWRR